MKPNLLKVNLGCGIHTPEGWINVDYAFGARLAKIPLFRSLNRRTHLFHVDWNSEIFIHDLRRRFPFKDNSVDVAYTSHTLEHFTKDEGQRFLEECYRVLKPVGILRVVVPDLEAFVSEYTNGEIASDEFVNRLGVTIKTSGRGFVKKFLAPYIAFPHKCMYDAKTLLKKLGDIGFEPQLREPFDSDIEDIKKTEIESRTRKAVIVEARKK